MKKIIAFVMIFAAVMCFAACSESSSDNDPSSSKQTTKMTDEVRTDAKLLTLVYHPGGEMTKEQFEADGKEHQLTAPSGSEIVGFSEIYKLVSGKFEQK